MLLHIICLVPTFGAFAWLIGACACEALAITATDAFTGGIVPSYLSDVSAERPGFLPMAFGGGLAAGCFLLQHAWLSRRYAHLLRACLLYLQCLLIAHGEYRPNTVYSHNSYYISTVVIA